jgi:hypothetical protein
VSGGILVVGSDGKATLVPSKEPSPSSILEPEVVTERKKQEALAKQRMHRQVALEMFCSQSLFVPFDPNVPDAEVNKARVDASIEAAAYLIEKTGGHQ